jgi:hypothetical protein
MKRRFKLLLLVAVVGPLACLVLSPGPIDGCYTFSDTSTSGHTFLYFNKGEVLLLNEFSKSPKHMGFYTNEHGRWLWTMRNSGRKVRVRPRLIYVTFGATDSSPKLAKLPFEWRDPRVFSAHRTIKAQQVGTAP